MSSTCDALLADAFGMTAPLAEWLIPRSLPGSRLATVSGALKRPDDGRAVVAAERESSRRFAAALAYRQLGVRFRVAGRLHPQPDGALGMRSLELGPLVVAEVLP